MLNKSFCFIEQDRNCPVLMSMGCMLRITKRLKYILMILAVGISNLNHFQILEILEINRFRELKNNILFSYPALKVIFKIYSYISIAL